MKESLAPVKKEEDIDRPAQRDAPTKYDGVAEATGQLHLFDPKTNSFMLQAENTRCQLLRTEQFKCKTCDVSR